MILKIDNIFQIFLNFTQFTKFGKNLLKKLKFENHLKSDPDVAQRQSTRRLKAQIR